MTQARLLVATFDGRQVGFADLTDCSEETLKTLEPHLDSSETLLLKLAREKGFNIAQQAVIVLSSKNPFRANELLSHV